MLVARRDPFHPGAHDAPYAHDAAGGGTPRLVRTVGMLQVIGSLLAIPVGLGSAYSIYRANFSVETTCQSLRADIISMIDKRVDAGTRRILVAPRRREVRAKLRRNRSGCHGGVQDVAGEPTSRQRRRPRLWPRQFPQHRRRTWPARSSRVRRRPPKCRPRSGPAPSGLAARQASAIRNGSMRSARLW